MLKRPGLHKGAGYIYSHLPWCIDTPHDHRQQWRTDSLVLTVNGSSCCIPEVHMRLGNGKLWPVVRPSQVNT
jgi:hypothetical protein